MSKNVKGAVLFLSFALTTLRLSAQDAALACRVELPNLAGKYAGDCKNGLAHGKGEAAGLHKYEGSFKKGLPDGKGTYHYNDGNYHEGNFSAGLKEGKGEAHFKREGQPDSVITGFWSGDVYRGRKYKTYEFRSSQTFDTQDLTATDGSKDVTIEIMTTSGSPAGMPTASSGGSGYVLGIRDLVATDGSFIRKSSSFATGNKTSSTYILTTFPVKLLVTLTNGQSIEMELFKPASWMVKLYLNK